MTRFARRSECECVAESHERLLSFARKQSVRLAGKSSDLLLLGMLYGLRGPKPRVQGNVLSTQEVVRYGSSLIKAMYVCKKAARM